MATIDRSVPDQEAWGRGGWGTSTISGWATTWPKIKEPDVDTQMAFIDLAGWT